MEIKKGNFLSTRSFDMETTNSLAGLLINRKRKTVNNLVEYLSSDELEEDEKSKLLKEIFESLEWMETYVFVLMQEITEDPYWGDEP